MMYRWPPTDAIAACRRGKFMGVWRCHCFWERSYSRTEHRCGEPFTTHTLPCNRAVQRLLHAMRSRLGPFLSLFQSIPHPEATQNHRATTA